MEIVAVGLDLVELDRFEALYSTFEPEVLARCFSNREQASVGTGHESLVRLAARFAAKEAVLKTIGGLQDGISLTEIEILSDGVSAPRVEVSGGARNAAMAHGVAVWLVSLTHTSQSAAAVAIALGPAPM